MKPIPEEFIQRKEKLLARLTAAENGCLEWSGARDPRGYGLIASSKRIDPANYKHYLAHRVFYYIASGEQPDGMHVCHKCDNTPCCNINHLFLGSHQDNMRDCADKGRMYKPMPFERSIKITEEVFQEARELYETTKLSITQIAKRHKVSKVAMLRVFKTNGVKIREYRRLGLKLGVKEITEIRRLDSIGVSNKKVAKLFNLREDYIWQICSGHRWGDIRTRYDRPNFRAKVSRT